MYNVVEGFGKELHTNFGDDTVLGVSGRNTAQLKN